MKAKRTGWTDSIYRELYRKKKKKRAEAEKQPSKWIPT